MTEVPTVATTPGEPREWRQSSRKRAEVAAISTIGYPVLRLLGSTWKWKVSGAEHVDSIKSRGLHPIHAFWHGRILPATLYFQRRGIVVITSENYDGEWIARIITKFGYGTARGSSSRGGPKALLQMVRDVKSKGVAFTLDGPRGPAEVAQPGAVWLAKATGHPVLPFHLEASRHWTMSSWDRTQVPKPFATVAIAMGEPVDVPNDADEGAIEAARKVVEERLFTLEQRAAALLR